MDGGTGNMSAVVVHVAYKCISVGRWLGGPVGSMYPKTQTPIPESQTAGCGGHPRPAITTDTTAMAVDQRFQRLRGSDGHSSKTSECMVSRSQYV